MKDIKCPFCQDEGFDLIGLKDHLQMGHCDVFEETLTVQQEKENNARP